MKNLILIILLLHPIMLAAQKTDSGKISMNYYAEIYYSYDFQKPDNNNKPGFIYNHKRHNEVNMNLFLVKAKYQDKNYRSNIGLMFGNYAQYNLSAEPTWAQFIYEANFGVKLSKKRNLWLDAGIFPSHIGFESAISADCWTLTRSILAENSPYYEAGLRMSYSSPNERLNMALLYLNGWQKISRSDYNTTPSFGFQFNYKLNSKTTFNYSNFIGSDKPDSVNALRHFHNFYLQTEPSKSFGIIIGFDIGSDKGINNKYSIWYSPVLILRKTINDHFTVALRGEYYSDKNQIIISTNSTNGFQTSGYSTNLDYKINDRLQFRVEGKLLNSKDKFFNDSRNNYSFTSNLTFRL